MTQKQLRGSRGLGLAAAAALVSAVALVAAVIAPASRGAAPAAPQADASQVVALHRTMDRLWQDHVTWTRMVIVSFAAGSPDLQPAVSRLLRNQVEIGNAIKPYYGAAAGKALTRLLQTHIRLAVPVLSAAKAGDQRALKRALAAWSANAHEIAAFLSKANPAGWPLAATTRMMDDHLRLTTAEAAARLKGDWKADIAAYDKVRAEILMMSGALADGIVAQFPDRFT